MPGMLLELRQRLKHALENLGNAPISAAIAEIATDDEKLSKMLASRQQLQFPRHSEGKVKPESGSQDFRRKSFAIH